MNHGLISAFFESINMKAIKVTLHNGSAVRIWNGKLSDNMTRALESIINTIMKIEPEQVPALLEMMNFLNFMEDKKYERDTEEE